MKPDSLKITIEVDVSNMSLIDAEKLHRSGIKFYHTVDGLGIVAIKKTSSRLESVGYGQRLE